jgi:hypothetical protein
MKGHHAREIILPLMLRIGKSYLATLCSIRVTHFDLTYMFIFSQGAMSLQPRPVNFDEMWGKLLPTVQGVIKLGNVPKSAWNEGFGYVFKHVCKISYLCDISEKSSKGLIR